MKIVAVLCVSAAAIFYVPEILVASPPAMTLVLSSQEDQQFVTDALAKDSPRLSQLSVTELVHEVAATASRGSIMTAPEEPEQKEEPTRKEPSLACKIKQTYVETKRHLRRGHRHHVATKGDAHCSQGITNVEMTVCCQSDCDECHDNSTICMHADYNGRGTTCCPTIMLGGDLPNCEDSFAPCEVPEYVRAPPSVDQLLSSPGQANAYDDCDEVIDPTDSELSLYQQFLEVKSKQLPGAVTDCTTTYGTKEQIAAACGSDDSCLGFTARTRSGKPRCKILSQLSIKKLRASGNEDIYLKRTDSAGVSYKFSVGPWSNCSQACGGGRTTRSVDCITDDPDSPVSFGMCMALTALNEDAVPPKSGECNSFGCTQPNYTVALTHKEIVTAKSLRKDLEPLNLAAISQSLEKAEEPQEQNVETAGFFFVGEQPGLSIAEDSVAWKFKVSSPDECFPPPDGTTIVVFESLIEGTDQVTCDQTAMKMQEHGRPLGMCQYGIATPIPQDAVPGYTEGQLEDAGMLSSKIPGCGSNVVFFANEPILYA